MRPEPPFLVVRKGVSFWVETRPPEDCSATLQALREGCFRDGWCYDSTGGGWPILEARPGERASLIHRLLPWKRLRVELQLGPRVTVELASLLGQLATVLRSNNEFCESLHTPPAELLIQLQRARAPGDIIHICRGRD